MGKTILILGGGTGGVVAANVLRKTLPMEHRVIVVDRNRNHYFQASYPLVLVNLRRPAQIVQRLERLEKKGIEFVQAEVQRVDFARRYVKTNQGRINYDYLIIALGAEQHLETVPGQAHRAYNPFDFYDVCRLRFLLSRLTRGHIVLYIANLPYTGVIAPFEIMFLLDAYLRQRGCRPNVRLSFVTPEPLPLSLAPPKVGQSVLRMMERRGIEVISQAKVLALDPRKKHLLLDGGLKIPGNLFLGIPSHWGPGLLRDTSLAPTGWIETDPHTLTTQVEGVYAVGDGVATRVPVNGAWAPKAGSFAHYQAEVVARNIASMILGGSPRWRYTGKAAGAVMLTGLGRGRLVSVNYYDPRGVKLSLLRPTRTAYWVKVAFEKYWLTRWF
ncbi:MAG: NAD(P)/FAD-dependent oxidoreductase [Limnochordia bacterium]